MKKIIVILACLLLLAAVPLFAGGRNGDHGRFHNDNSHRWQGSSTHPSSHGWRGWGKAPCRAPDGVPAENPSPEPPDHPGNTPVGQPGDKSKADNPVEGTQVLDLARGSIIG